MKWSLAFTCRITGLAVLAPVACAKNTFQSALSLLVASVVPYHTKSTRPALPASIQGMICVFTVCGFPKRSLVTKLGLLTAAFADQVAPWSLENEYQTVCSSDHNV